MPRDGLDPLPPIWGMAPQRSNGWQCAPGLREGQLWVTPSLAWFWNQESARGFSLDTGALIREEERPPEAPFTAELSDRSMVVTPLGGEPYAQKLPVAPRSGPRRWWQPAPLVLIRGKGVIAAFELTKTRAVERWKLACGRAPTTSVEETASHVWLKEHVEGGTRFRGVRLADGEVEHDFRLELDAWGLTATDELLLVTAMVDRRLSVLAISPGTRAIESTFALLSAKRASVAEPPDSTNLPEVRLHHGVAVGENYVVVPRRVGAGWDWAVAPIPHRWPTDVTGHRMLFTVRELIACLDLQSLAPGRNGVTLDRVDTPAHEPKNPTIATVTWVGGAIASADVPGHGVENFSLSTGHGPVSVGARIVVHGPLGTSPSDTLKIKSWSLLGVTVPPPWLEPLTEQALPPVAEPIRTFEWRGAMARLQQSAGAEDLEVRWFVEHATEAVMKHLDTLEIAFRSDFEWPVWAGDNAIVPFATQGREYGVEYAYFFVRAKSGNTVFGGHYQDEPDGFPGFMGWLTSLVPSAGDSDEPGTARARRAVLEFLETRERPRHKTATPRAKPARRRS